MLVRIRLVALILLAHNGCGSTCPEITCDDVINLIFSAPQEGDYRLTFAGQSHDCIAGEPQSEGLLACGPSGALLRSSADELSVSVQGDSWAGQGTWSITRARPINREQPDCEIPCTRGEIPIDIN